MPPFSAHFAIGGYAHRCSHLHLLLPSDLVNVHNSVHAALEISSVALSTAYLLGCLHACHALVYTIRGQPFAEGSVVVQASVAREHDRVSGPVHPS